MKVKLKRLNDKAVIPSYSKPEDAGLDLTATSYEYRDNRHVYGTGLAIEIPEGYVGLIYPRSSICKYDLRLSNSVGVIDSGYRGEIKFFFENEGMCMTDPTFKQWLNNERRLYGIGDRIGQIIIMPYPKVELEEVEELSNSERGNGGFGSSGK